MAINKKKDNTKKKTNKKEVIPGIVHMVGCYVFL